MLVLFRKLFNDLKVGNENEHGIDKNSECFKHLQEHFSYECKWSLLSIVSRNTFKRVFYQDNGTFPK